MKFVKALTPFLLISVLLSCSTSAEDEAREMYYELAAEEGIDNQEFLDCALDIVKESTGLSWEALVVLMETDEDPFIDNEPEDTAGVLECLSLLDDDELERLTGDDSNFSGSSSSGEPMNYGDDAYLDSLYDSCARGNADACDTLFWESPLDSEYETFALLQGS